MPPPARAPSPATIVPTFALTPGAETLLAGVAQGATADVRAYHLRLMALRLGLVAGFDDLLALDALELPPLWTDPQRLAEAVRGFNALR